MLARISIGRERWINATEVPPVKCIAWGLLLAIVIITPPFANTGPVVQKYRDGGGWKEPYPGPDRAEIALIAGSYRVLISGNRTMWHDKILTIKSIAVVPVKDIYPTLTMAASITVPRYWDTVKELPIEAYRLQQRFDAEKKRTRITALSFTIDVNLKESGRERFEFEGYYIERKRSFVGTVKHNGDIVGGFIAEKIR